MIIVVDPVGAKHPKNNCVALPITPINGSFAPTSIRIGVGQVPQLNLTEQTGTHVLFHLGLMIIIVVVNVVKCSCFSCLRSGLTPTHPIPLAEWRMNAIPPYGITEMNGFSDLKQKETSRLTGLSHH